MDVVRAAPLEDPSVVEPSPTAEFLERLTTALLEYGLPVHRLEAAVQRLARALAVTVDFVCTPTSLILAVGEGDRASIRVVRVEPSGADFGRLAALYALVGRVERREVSPGEGSQRIVSILARPTEYPRVLWLGAHGLVSLASAVLLGAGTAEVLAATGLGLSSGALASLATSPNAARLLPTFASALAAAVGFGLEHFIHEVSPLRLVLAAVIAFLPGYATTVGMMELATGNLVSGSARVAGAMARFLLLALGVAIGERCIALLGMPLDPSIPAPSTPVFRGFEYLSPALAGAAFTVLLRARARDMGWIVLVCYASTFGVFAGGYVLGPTLSSFAGAFVAAAVSNLVGRMRDRPSTVLVTPAILLLVPGGVGFLGLSSLLHQNVDAGLEMAVRVALVAVAIAAGLMTASLAVPATRSL